MSITNPRRFAWLSVATGLLLLLITPLFVHRIVGEVAKLLVLLEVGLPLLGAFLMIRGFSGGDPGRRTLLLKYTAAFFGAQVVAVVLSVLAETEVFLVYLLLVPGLLMEFIGLKLEILEAIPILLFGSFTAAIFYSIL